MSAPEKSKNQAIVSADSEQQLKHYRELTERMDDAINGLKAFDTLMAGNQDRAISDLSSLVTPFIENMASINAELMSFFYSSGVVFAYPVKADGDKPAKQEACHD